MKKVLIAGAGGYIGSLMTESYLEKGYKVIALDRFFFGNTLNHLKSNKSIKIVKDDIRNFDKKNLKNVDLVINLASISNDPASELDTEATKDINHLGALRLAKLAKEMNVKRYIFSSSCSVYGSGSGVLREKSKLNPVSAYAKSKIDAEKSILDLASKNFCVTVLRLATVYGLSRRRMRFDLIINIMTLHAWKNGKIFIMGGGRQWRPVVHIRDVIKAFELIGEEDPSKINKEVFNVGSNEQVYQVFKITNLFKKYFSNLEIDKAPDDPDPRNYNVNFDKIKKMGFTTEKTVDDGIMEIKAALDKGEIVEDVRTNTLWYYQYLIKADKILSDIKLKGKLL